MISLVILRIKYCAPIVRTPISKFVHYKKDEKIQTNSSKRTINKRKDGCNCEQVKLFLHTLISDVKASRYNIYEIISWESNHDRTVFMMS